MNLIETVCYANNVEEADVVLNDTRLLDLMTQAAPQWVKKISLSGYSNTRAVYVLGDPRVIRILDNLIRDL